ncbi:MAG: SEL1-like repeat protein [Desulfovibrio sp.]|nr:SEL1-like repeat protein [Desulfovibrio sp.]
MVQILLFSLFVVLCLCETPSVADTGQKIARNAVARDLFLTAYRSAECKEYQKAFDAYAKAAAMDYAPAQYNLGRMYLLGNGIASDPKQAFSYFSMAAERGLVLAQYTLGSLYESGVGVAKDEAKALFWYARAAAKGDSESQFRMGIFLEDGLGGEKDYPKAAQWYEKAALQGHAGAQNNLGTLLDKGGEGIEANPARAVFWYHKAAMQGHALAQKNLATCYERGHGVRKDAKKARLWMGKAQRKRVEDPLDPLDTIPDMRPLAKQPSQSTVQERPIPFMGLPKDAYLRLQARLDAYNAQEPSTADRAKNPSKDEPPSTSHVLNKTEEGVSKPKNPEAGDADKASSSQGVEKTEEGASKSKDTEAGDADKASSSQGVEKTEEGASKPKDTEAGDADKASSSQGVEKTKEGAFKSKDAEAGEPVLSGDRLVKAKALYREGMAYEFGRFGGRKQVGRAIRRYREAARLGYAPASYRLGLMYEGFPAEEKDKERAFYYYFEAAKRGHAKACQRLGGLYERGFGVAKDESKAAQWYEKAKALGIEAEEASRPMPEKP